MNGLWLRAKAGHTNTPLVSCLLFPVLYYRQRGHGEFFGSRQQGNRMKTHVETDHTFKGASLKNMDNIEFWFKRDLKWLRGGSMTEMKELRRLARQIK